MLDFELVAAWFDRLTPVLRQFVDQRHLTIERYSHNTPAWRFKFAYPHGGHGAIDLWRKGEALALINTVAWIDDPNTDRRHLKTHNGIECEATHEGIRRALNAAMDELLTWDPPRWLNTTTDPDVKVY